MLLIIGWPSIRDLDRVDKFANIAPHALVVWPGVACGGRRALD